MTKSNETVLSLFGGSAGGIENASGYATSGGSDGSCSSRVPAGPAQSTVGAVQRLDGGWRVRSTELFHVDILRMLGGNLRVVTTPVSEPWSYTRAWCYRRPWVEVVLLAAAFDPDGPQEPAGWIKQVGTQRRACGWLWKSARREHAGFIPKCPECGDETLI